MSEELDTRIPANNGRFVRTFAVAGVSFILLLVVSGLSLTDRGRREMAASDKAFHGGDLRGAVVSAKAAALAYVPGSDHVLSSYARLTAIAQGAEAQGDHPLARLAWETLCSVHTQTAYPGRPSSSWEKNAVAGLRRIDEAQRPAHQ